MKVKYEFVNETVEVEVDEQWATVIAELDRRDYNNDKKETRRHTTLDNGFDDGEWLAVEDKGLTALFEDTEQLDRLASAMAHLNEKQRDLVRAVYFDGVSVNEYAAKEGVDHSAISHRLQTIHNKIKRYF